MAAGDFETTVQIPYFLGIDQRQGDANTALTTAYNAQNVSTERGILMSASGYAPAMPAIQGEATIGTLARFYRRNHEPEDEREVFVAATLGGIYTWTDGEAAWTKRYGVQNGVLQSDAWAYVTYEATRNGAQADVLLMTNSKDGMVIIYGDDLSAEKLTIALGDGGAELKFASIERHAERIWGCGQPGEPDSLYYSRPYDPLNWDPIEETPELGGGVIRQPTWNGDEFIALRRMGAYIAACKRNSLFVIRGTDPSTFTIEEIAGADAPNAAAGIGIDRGQMFYPSEEGIATCDTEGASILSKHALYELMQLRASGSEKKAVACVARHVYYLALAIKTDVYDTGTSENNTIIEYDILRGTFLVRRGIHVKSFLASGGEVYFTTTDAPYQVYKLGVGSTHNNMPVKRKWESAWIDQSARNVMKSAFELRFYAKGDAGATMRLTIETEKKEKQKTIALYETGKMHKVRIQNRGRRWRLKIETDGTQAWRIEGGMQIKMDVDGE